MKWAWRLASRDQWNLDHWLIEYLNVHLTDLHGQEPELPGYHSVVLNRVQRIRDLPRASPASSGPYVRFDYANHRSSVIRQDVWTRHFPFFHICLQK